MLIGQTTRAGSASFALRLAGFGAIVLAIRLMLIARFASPLPFWDEWGHLLGRLLVKYADGFPPTSLFFVPTGAHWIVPSKVLALMAYLVDGQYNPLLLMAVSSFVHAAICMGLAWFLARRCPGIPETWAFLVVSVLQGLPYNLHNILWGYQTVFYFMTGFALLAIYGLLVATPRSFVWWLGLAAGIGCTFSLGGGLLPFAAVAGVSTLGTLVHRGARVSHIPSLIAGVAGSVAGLLILPYGGGDDHRAESIEAFATTFAKCLSFPFVDSPWAALLLNAPLAAYVLTLLVRRRWPTTPCLYILAIALWIAVYSAAIGYARARSGIAPPIRQFEVLALLPLCNFCCFGLLASEIKRSYLRRLASLALACWATLISVGLYTLIRDESLPWLEKRTAMMDEQLEHTRAYLISGDLAALEHDERFAIPAPSAEQLADKLDDPRMRRALPHPVYVPIFEDWASDADTSWVPDGFHPKTGRYRGEPALGSWVPGRLGPRNSGNFVTPLIGIKQSRMLVPLAGYLKDLDTTLHLVESRPKPEDFHTYSLDMPEGPINRIRIDPATARSEIIIESIAVRVSGESIPLPTFHSSARLSPNLEHLRPLPEGEYYRVHGPDASMEIPATLLPPGIGLTKINLQIRMWSSASSTLRVYWDVGNGFSAAESVDTPINAASIAPAEMLSASASAGVTSPNTRRISPHTTPRESWIEVPLATPRYPFRLVGTDHSDQLWFALAGPRGIGPASHYLSLLLQRVEYLLALGAFLILAGAAGSLFASARDTEPKTVQPAEPSTGVQAP